MTLTEHCTASPALLYLLCGMLIHLATAQSVSTGSLYACTIFVDSSGVSSAQENCSCATGSNHTLCANLGAALQAVGNSTQVVLRGSRSHTLSRDNPPPIFRWLHDVSLVGADGSDMQQPAKVVCTPEVGLTFIHSKRISVEGVEFHGCGSLHNSTSRDFSLPGTLSFLEFSAALYFELCQDVSFTHVTVAYSSGIGLVLYSTVGMNSFKHCIFANNSVDGTTEDVGGGGVYVEFPYCPPGRPKECADKQFIPEQHHSNATYHFTDSSFEGNYAASNHPAEYHVEYPPHKNHHSLGRGGGLCMYLCVAENVSIEIEGCNFTRNRAVMGGGLLMEFLTETRQCKFEMIASNIDHNYASFYQNFSIMSNTGGGGMKAGFAMLRAINSSDNSMVFRQCRFQGNQAYWGGGLSLLVSREPQKVEPTNTVEFHDCEWTNNMGMTGSALDLYVYFLATPGVLTEVKFTDCHFIGNTDNLDSPPYIPPGKGAVYVEAVPVTFHGSILFQSNIRSAVAAVNSAMDFGSDCSALFFNNSGKDGGALLLTGHAFIRVHQNTTMSFINNFASRYSGAIHAVQLSENSLYSVGNCFIQYEDLSLGPQNWTANFIFKNNTSYVNSTLSLTINSIGAVSLYSCIWMDTEVSQYVPDRQLIEEVFCWNDRWNYIGSDCKEDIYTSPATYNQSFYSISTYPGRPANMKIKMTDDRGNDATERAVFTAWTDSSEAKLMYYSAGNRITLQGEGPSDVLVHLATLEPRRVFTHLNVTLLKCPLGFHLDNDKCVCNGTFTGLVKCYESSFNASLQRGYWIGRYNDQTVVGISPYMGPLKHAWIKLYETDLGVNEQLCGPTHRNGRLCGECQQGFGVSATTSAGSPYDCVKCNKTIDKWKYLLSQYGFATAFFFLVWFLSFLGVGATKGPATAFIFFAQVITTTFDITGDGTIRVGNGTLYTTRVTYTLLYEVWNLSYFCAVLKDWCIAEKLSIFEVMAIKYINALYPILFITIVYLIGKCTYSRCRNRVIRVWLRKSLVDVFATFIILSYSKLTIISVYLLTPSYLYNHIGEVVDSVMYYDGTTTFLSTEHKPFFALALLVMIFFVLFPPLVLLVYPSLISKGKPNHQRKCCSFLKLSDVKRIIVPKPKDHDTELVDQSSREGNSVTQAQEEEDDHKGFLELLFQSFQRCYKDGSVEGWRDCRYFAGIYLLFRTFLFLAFIYTREWIIQYIIQQVVCMIGILFFTTIRPYRNSFYNNLDATIFGILATINVISIYNVYCTTLDNEPYLDFYIIIQIILIFTPLLYLLVYIGYALWKVDGSRRIIQYIGRPIIKILCFPCFKCYRACCERLSEEEPNNIQSQSASFRDDSFREFMSIIDHRRRKLQHSLFTNTEKRDSSCEETQSSSHPLEVSSLVSDSASSGANTSGYGTTMEVSVYAEQSEARNVPHRLQTGQSYERLE